MNLSVLLPHSDQVVNVERLLELLSSFDVHEIIFAGKTGQRETVEAAGATFVQGTSMRGSDFNAAARVATGDVFVLLHQNTVDIPSTLFDDIKHAMRDPSVIGGAVNVAFDNQHWMMRLVAWLSNNYRMRLRKLPYIDQTIFVRADVYRHMGGFKDIPIFEDTDFSARLRRQGSLVFLDGSVVTSAHRFEKNGLVFHTLRNQLLKAMYTIGISPFFLKRFYEWTAHPVQRSYQYLKQNAGLLP